MSSSLKNLACGAVLAVAATLPAITTASAADLAAPEPMVAEALSSFDIAFGFKASSDYLVRGISQTNGDPALQGYAELQAFDWVYAGVWASNVSFGGAQDPSAEVDYYGGVRHSFGPLTLDAGYVWVDFTGEDKGSRTLAYGKVYGVVKYAVTENFDIGANVYYGTDYINLGAEITHATAFAKYKFSPFAANPDIGAYVSGSFSHMWTSKNFVPDYSFWDAGAGLTYKGLTLDVRYNDSNLSKRECGLEIGHRNACGDRYLVSLSFDTSINKLK
jgi:uncharacterized protein (TIGR02001 family)